MMHHEIPRLGFIGIGLMGLPMTLRLLAAGFPVTVWNRSPEKLQPVIDAGAQASASIAELVSTVDIIMLCLADTAVVETIVQQHILPNGSPDKLVIDLSSIHPETTRNLAKLVQDRCSMSWVDAPVSGGVVGAEQGSLAIMAGGKEADIAKARKVLAPLYGRLTHMGEVGSGQIAKICNQMIVSCNVVVIAEMMAFAKRAGVDVEQLPVALSGGFADSKPLQIVGTQMASETFEPIAWRVKTLLKDLTMALDCSNQSGNAIPMSALAAQLMRMHGIHGYLEQDPSTLIKLFTASDLA